MLSTILRFELKHWFVKPSVYVYALVFFLLAMGMMAGAAGLFDEESRKVISIANSPWSIYGMAILLNKLLLFLLPAIVGHSVYRDYQTNAHSILYSFPFSKADYLAGKFLSAFFIVCLIALMIALGFITGLLLPGVNYELVQSFDGWAYLHLFGVYLLPNLLVFSIVVFAIVVFFRNIYAAFITISLLFIAREILTRVIGDINNSPFALLLEPLGETVTYYFTQSWDIDQQNRAALPFEKLIIYNRVIWLSFATALMAIIYKRFRFSQSAILFSFWNNTKKAAINSKAKTGKIALSEAHYQFSFFGQIMTAWKISDFEFKSIIKSGPFISILIGGSLLVFIILYQMNPPNETPLMPLTWVMLAFPVFFFSMLINFLTFLYAGILVHRARAARIHELVNVSSATNWMLLSAHFFALIKMQISLLLVLMFAGILVQTSSGYYHFEIFHYLFDLFGIHLIGFVIWAFAALFVQTLLTNPYLGLFFLMLGYFGVTELPELGISHLVFLFNHNPEPVSPNRYSDLSAYGHSLLAYFTYKTYWTVFACCLFVATLLLWSRERFFTFKERLWIAWERLRGILAYSLGLGLVLFLVMGFVLFQNEKKTEEPHSKEKNQLLSQFETKYNILNQTTQPRITSIFITTHIFSASHSFQSEGAYTLVNKSQTAIDTLLLKAGFDEITTFKFDKKTFKISEDKYFKFSIYKLEKSLLPGDSMHLFFTIKNSPNTWLTSYPNIYKNGASLRKDILPRLGYFAKTTPLLPTDSAALKNNYQSIDSDLVDFESVVSTSPDQTAVAPGRLLKTWTANGRKYAHYKMQPKTKFLFSLYSSQYEMRRDSIMGVALQIYYHKKHTYCLNNMIEGLKSSLAYNTKYFGAYPHQQIKVIEYPLTEGTFGTLTGDCIPISEIHFIADPQKAEQGHIDFAFYIAAHELTHQWWGNQVIPADALGALMITESVSEYITAKIYERTYGKQKALQFLKLQRRRYLKGRQKEDEKESPLVLVQADQTHIAYGKGALAFYTLSEYIGEEKLNKALKEYLDEAKKQVPPYAVSTSLISHLRRASPDSLQNLITDLFERSGPVPEKIPWELN